MGTGSSAVANPSEGGGSLVGNVDDKSDSGHDAATVPAPEVGDPVIGKCDEDVSDTRAPSFSGKSPQDQITREEPLSRDVKDFAEQLDRKTDELNEAQEKLDDVVEGELRSFQDHFLFLSVSC